MKKYLVYVEKVDGTVDRYQCFAESKEQAKETIKSTFQEVVRAAAFDYDYFIRLE